MTDKQQADAEARRLIRAGKGKSSQIISALQRLGLTLKEAEAILRGLRESGEYAATGGRWYRVGK